MKFRVGDRVKTTVQAMTFSKGEMGTVVKDIGKDWYTVHLDSGTTHLISVNELELETSINYMIDEQDNILPVGNQVTMDSWLNFTDDGGFAPDLSMEESEPPPLKCECGVAAVGGSNHSTWCPIKNV